MTRRHGARRICPVDIGDIDARILTRPNDVNFSPTGQSGAMALNKPCTILRITR